MRKRHILPLCFLSVSLLLGTTNIVFSQSVTSNCIVTKVGNPQGTAQLPAGCQSTSPSTGQASQSAPSGTGQTQAGDATSPTGWPIDMTAPGVAVTQCPFDPRWDHGPDNLNAVDIGAPEGTPIYATMDGTVSVAGNYDGYGNAVIIGVKLAGGAANSPYALYGHMITGSIVVSVGQHVTKGQLLGKVDSTGYSTGNHVHYELQLGGVFPHDTYYLGFGCS